VPSEEAKMQSDYDEFRPRLLEEYRLSVDLSGEPRPATCVLRQRPEIPAANPEFRDRLSSLGIPE